MAGIKISALPAAASSQLTDVFPAVQSGVTYKETLQQVLTLFQSPSSGFVLLAPTAAQTILTYPLNVPGGIYTPSILDSNGNLVWAYTTAASAVNYLTTYNAATGNSPSIQASGSDSNVNLGLAAKADGIVFINSLNSTPFQISSGTTYQHITNFTFANTAQTRTVTFPDATGTLLMSGVAINSVPSITFSSTSGIIGTTTNDSASAGSVGEFVTASKTFGSAVTLTTGTAANIVSVSLTAGDWDVWGTSTFSSASASTLFTLMSGYVSSTSATYPSDSSLTSSVCYQPASTATAANNPSFSVSPMRFSLSTTTTIYLGALANFSVADCLTYGAIYARRRR